MKHLLLYFLIMVSGLFIACTNTPSDGYEDEITGIWYTQGKAATIKISANDDNYYGKIVDLKRPLDRDGEPKRDFRNPDPDKKTNLLQGTKVLPDVEYKGDKVWKGVYYEYKTGKKHDVKIKLTGQGQLLIQSPDMERDMTWYSEYPVGSSSTE